MQKLVKIEPENINWEEVRDRFERTMAEKLSGLPGHREVLEERKEFRKIISHELPESTSKAVFRKLIDLLCFGEEVDVYKIKKEFLYPELKRERSLLNCYKDEFKKLKKSAKVWVEKNFSEEKLQEMWKNHKTWLPRRYLIYFRQVPFQKIAADTLARFYLTEMAGFF